MKKAILIFVIVLTMVLLTGCTPLDTIPSKKQEPELSMLMIHTEYSSGLILVDRETNVMYWMSNGAYNSGTLTLLVDQYGNPKIWEGQ